MMGSPFYMAPEQWHDEEIDVRADIYSLGVILYQMLAGDVPFNGKSIPSIMNMHLNTAPVPLSERAVEVPEALERAVQHALEKDPARRPKSVGEFAAELRAALPELDGAALAREPGMQTVHIGPVDTMGLSDKKGFETGAQDSSPDILKTVASTPDALGTNALEEGPAQPLGMKTVADSSLAPGDDRMAPRASDTTRQQPAQTFGHFASGDALTEPLPAVADTQRAEEERRRAQEEEQRRREAEESQRREAEERERLEAEERA